MHSSVRGLFSWVRRHINVWDRIHISGIAIRSPGGWASIWLKIELSDRLALPPAGAPIFESPDLMAFQVTTGIASMRPLYRSLLRGLIGPDLLGGLQRPLLTQAPLGQAFRGLWPRSYVPCSSPGWPRWEATATGGNIGTLFGSEAAAFQQLSRIEQVFLALNGGSVSEIARELDLFPFGVTLGPSHRTEARLVAPLPTRFLDIKQTDERDAVQATIEIGPLIPRVAVKVTAYTGIRGVVVAPVPLPNNLEETTVVCVSGLPECDAKIRLVYGGDCVVDERPLTILPPTMHDPLSVAVDTVQAQNDLLKRGLEGDDEYLFERSVSHLLALVGYRTLWWGPNRKGTPMPEEPVDALAASPDGSELIVVECSTEQVPDKKIRILAGRASMIAARLEEKFRPNAPVVSALLVLARSEVPESLRRLLGEDRIGLMTRKDAAEVLDRVRAGATRGELLKLVRGFCFAWTLWAPPDGL